MNHVMFYLSIKKHCSVILVCIALHPQPQLDAFFVMFSLPTYIFQTSLKIYFHIFELNIELQYVVTPS